MSALELAYDAEGSAHARTRRAALQGSGLQRERCPCKALQPDVQHGDSNTGGHAVSKYTSSACCRKHAVGDREARASKASCASAASGAPLDCLLLETPESEVVSERLPATSRGGLQARGPIRVSASPQPACD